MVSEQDAISGRALRAHAVHRRFHWRKGQASVLNREYSVNGVSIPAASESVSPDEIGGAPGHPVTIASQLEKGLEPLRISFGLA
jgi:hypothetical protein